MSVRQSTLFLKSSAEEAVKPTKYLPNFTLLLVVCAMEADE